MKPLLLLILTLLPVFTLSQDACMMEGLPCYAKLWGEKEKGTSLKLSEWNQFEKQIEETYDAEISFHQWKQENEMDRYVVISAIVLTSAKRPFTVLEKYQYSWGGIFYYKDFLALTEQKYLELEARFKN